MLKTTKCVSSNWFSMAWVRIAAVFQLRIIADPCTRTITSCSDILDFTGCACVVPAENLGAYLLLPLSKLFTTIQIGDTTVSDRNVVKCNGVEIHSSRFKPKCQIVWRCVSGLSSVKCLSSDNAAKDTAVLSPYCLSHWILVFSFHKVSTGAFDCLTKPKSWWS